MSRVSRRVLAVVLVATSLGGCTGYKHIALGAAPPAPGIVAARMEVGQTVRVEMRDATVKQITIAAIEADALVGEKGERIRFADIVAAERKGIDLSNTLWVTFGVYMLIGFVMLVSNGG